MKPSDFYTVPRSEEGTRVPLATATGEDSGHWLVIYGPDAKAFVRAHREMTRAYAELGEVTDDNEEQAVAIHREWCARLVKAWSFDTEFTHAAVVELLANAPGIANSIELVARDYSRFFGPGSPSSTNGPQSNANFEAAAGSASPSGSDSSRHDARQNSPTSSGSGVNSDREP